MGGRRVWSQNPVSAKAMQVTHTEAACQQRERHKWLQGKNGAATDLIVAQAGLLGTRWTERILLSAGRSSGLLPKRC